MGFDLFGYFLTLKKFVKKFGHYICKSSCRTLHTAKQISRIRLRRAVVGDHPQSKIHRKVNHLPVMFKSNFDR